jgi:cysteine desulfurase
MAPLRRVYLDWNATTPQLPAVADAMRSAANDAWANPSSVHAHGRLARARVEDARAAIADLACVDVRDVIFTSGGTEANNIAIRSAFASEPGTLVTSRLEHPSVTRVAEALEREGRAKVRWLAVSKGGTVDLDDLARALAEGGVRLVALQAVNQETGVFQPVREVAALVERARARLHVDAVQAFGRTNELAVEADTRSLAGHKLRGPKGIGALVTKPGVRLDPVLLGGAQERGLRPGTVDPVGAAGLAVAVVHARTSPARYAALAPMRSRLEAALVALNGVMNVDAAYVARAPHVVSVSWAGWVGAELAAALDLEDISISSGSACSAGTIEPSPVIEAMLGTARASSSVRVSMGEDTSEADVDACIEAFRRVIARA